MMDDTVDVIIKKQTFLFIFLQVVSSVSSRLHLNRLSRPDLSLADLSANWRRRVRVPHLAAPRVDWSVIGSRLRLGLSRVKVEVPAIKMPPIRSRRGWCGCFQVSYIRYETTAYLSTHLRLLIYKYARTPYTPYHLPVPNR